MIHQDVTALVRGAGSGQRLGLGPKAFLELEGRTLVEWAVEPMLEVAARVLAAVPAADLERARPSLEPLGVEVMVGGATRLETTRKLLAAADTTWVIFHDAAHPFVTRELTERVLENAFEEGAAVSALRTRDFHYDADGGLVSRPGQLHLVQTPFIVRRADILEGFELLAAGDPRVGKEASTLEMLAATGHTWRFVDGPATNIKVTYPEDLELARAIAASRVAARRLDS